MCGTGGGSMGMSSLWDTREQLDQERAVSHPTSCTPYRHALQKLHSHGSVVSIITLDKITITAEAEADSVSRFWGVLLWWRHVGMTGLVVTTSQS